MIIELSLSLCRVCKVKNKKTILKKHFRKYFLHNIQLSAGRTKRNRPISGASARKMWGPVLNYGNLTLRYVIAYMHRKGALIGEL